MQSRSNDFAVALLDALQSGWRSVARPNQIAPAGDWSIWLIMAGRGFGKTRSGAEWTLEQISAGYRRIALVAATAADVRDVMVTGESGILACSPDWNRPTYDPDGRSQRQLFIRSCDPRKGGSGRTGFSYL